MRRIPASTRERTRSRAASVAASESNSGATSRSWKVKKGTPSFSKNSKATCVLRSARATGSPAPNHGRSKVSAPNMSVPGQQNVCHQHTAMRSWSAMRLPRTIASGSYQR